VELNLQFDIFPTVVHSDNPSKTVYPPISLTHADTILDDLWTQHSTDGRNGKIRVLVARCQKNTTGSACNAGSSCDLRNK
jgi:hypothetical protein